MSEPITELELIRLRSMREPDAALILDGCLRDLEDAYKRSFIERGIVLLEVQERKLWRHLASWDGEPYHSFEAWVCEAAPHSRSDCFAALSAVKELRDIPREQLAEIPRCNISVLKSLSSGVRAQPEVIAAAQALPEKEFREKIRTEHPNQHLSSKRRLILDFDSEDYETVCAWLDSVGELLGLTDRESELLALAIDWKQENVKA